MMSTIEMNGVSDTEGDKNEDVKEPLRASPVATPVSARKVSAPILKKSSTAANLVKQLGMDHDIVKEMIADGFDPTQVREWERFRNCSIGESSMLAARDRIEDWRNRTDSFGQ